MKKAFDKVSHLLKEKFRNKKKKDGASRQVVNIFHFLFYDIFIKIHSALICIVSRFGFEM